MKLLTILALCLLAQGAFGGSKDHSGDYETCELYPHPHACGIGCKYPFYKCCVSEKYVCKDCFKYGGYCVEDDEYCVTKRVKKCEKVYDPHCYKKYVCEDKTKKVCDYVYEPECKKVPVDKCYDKCETKKVCKKELKCKIECKHRTAPTREDNGSGTREGPTTREDNGSGTREGPTTREDNGSGTREGPTTREDNGEPKRSRFFGRRDRHDRRLMGCRPEKKCEYVDVCYDKPVCKKVCKTEYKEVCERKKVYKCKDVNHEDCGYVDVCKPKYRDVCTYEDIEECKDPVKCGPHYCGKYEKCNPHCCEKIKEPKCVKA